MPTGSARPHSKTLFGGTVKMLGKPPSDAFYQPTDNVFGLRAFERVTPLKTRLSAYCKCLGRLRKLFRVL